MARWRGEAAAVKEQRRMAQRGLDELKDAFFTLDVAQRAVRTAVDAYLEILPDRVSRSGLVPGFRVIDSRAEQRVSAYLALVDKYPTIDDLDERQLRPAGHDYSQLTEELLSMAVELDGFLENYAAEFALIARESRKIEEQRHGAAVAVAEAQRSWESLRRSGFESATADRALAKARVAQRAVDAWDRSQGRAQLTHAAELVNRFAAEVREICSRYPAQVDRARRRAPSLRTRLDAIVTRSAGIPDDLGHLRREFSTRNWVDLDGGRPWVVDLVGTARSLVEELAAAVGRLEWDSALRRLEEAEHAVQAADEAVDAVRGRLTLLRAFRDAPAARFDKVRFALKDAQVLMVNGPVRDTADMVEKLDSLARQLDGLRSLTEAVHPDYLSILARAEKIEKDVATEVARYRARAR